MRTAISYVIFIEILFLLLVDAKSLNLSGKYIPNGRGLQLYKSCARSRALLIPVYIIIIHTFLHTVASSPSPIHSPSLKVGLAFERKKTTVIDPSKGPSRIGLLHNLALSPISVPLHTDETTSCIRNRPSSRQHAEPHASSRPKKMIRRTITVVVICSQTMCAQTLLRRHPNSTGNRPPSSPPKR